MKSQYESKLEGQLPDDDPCDDVSGPLLHCWLYYVKVNPKGGKNETNTNQDSGSASYIDIYGSTS